MSEVSAKSVLLVDDDPSLRDLLSMQLEEAGFKAQQAEDGIDGLVKLRGELPQVIISDLQMPRMSGFEFISVVRRRFPSIPVIAISGSIPSEFPLEAQPDVCFEKGALQISKLLQVLHDLVRKTPDRPYLPQVISIPVRTRPGGDGYFVLTCTDCLRLFQVTSTPENKKVARVAVTLPDRKRRGCVKRRTPGSGGPNEAIRDNGLPLLHKIPRELSSRPGDISWPHRSFRGKSRRQRKSKRQAPKAKWSNMDAVQTQR
jgi:CheY-like chemotaxis protein